MVQSSTSRLVTVTHADHVNVNQRLIFYRTTKLNYFFVVVNWTNYHKKSKFIQLSYTAKR